MMLARTAGFLSQSIRQMSIRSSPAHSNGFVCQSPHRPDDPGAVPVSACTVQIAMISIQPAAITAAAAEAQPRA